MQRIGTPANRRAGTSGRGDFISCPLDSSHLWTALRYVELNPVRAGMVACAAEWRWSSAVAHCGVTAAEPWLEVELWEKRWAAEAWKRYLSDGESGAELTALRQFTHTGRPLGTAEFVTSLEQTTLRLLAPRRRGRPRKSALDSKQTQIRFVA